MMQKIFCLRTFSTTLLIFFTCFFLSFSLKGQKEMWTAISPDLLPKETAQQFKAFQLFQLDKLLFIKEANRIKKEATSTKVSHIFLPIPIENSSTFQAIESPIVQKGLSDKYPDYYFFKVIAKENPLLQGRITWTAKGLYAHLTEAEQSIFIEQVEIDGMKDMYIVYSGENQNIERTEGVICGNSLFENKRITPPLLKEEVLKNNDLKTFRLAITATEDFTNDTGETIEGTLSVLMNSVTSLNVIYERDVAVRFLLHAENDRLIFTDTTPSPFSGSRDAFPLLIEHSMILDSIIGVDSYDIGHVYSADCTGGVSGVAFLASVCSGQKANGVSCVFNENLAEFRKTLFHEVGHQLGANHTWSNCGESTNESQRNPATAVEPGSGSTIMSYGGVCGSLNIVTSSLDNFHGISILEINETLSRDTITCFESIPSENTSPTVMVRKDTFAIPILTPFELTAHAFDAENTLLTYSWEQFDTGAVSEIEFPIGDSPSFRAYFPIRDSVRVFPRLTNVVLNRASFAEVLPDTSRAFKFGVTVRDNDPNGGSTVFDLMNFVATAEAGPFLLTFPDSSVMEFPKNDTIEVRWNVANTDQSPVNCGMVDLYLSFNNGEKFPLLLAEKIPNNGLTTVVLPDTTTNRARIKIKCSDNIFFDVSNNRIRIIEPIISSTKEEVLSQQISLYPNPAKDLVHLSLPERFQKPITISIFDALGRLIKTEQLTSKNGVFSLSTQQFSKGVYFIKGQAEEELFSKRMIIQR